ncbi:hypothetical protein D3C72_698300 [compost metagenome]
MQTLEMALRDLVLAKKISFEDALSKSSKPDDLAKMVGPMPAAGGPGARPGAPARH